jgi:hypothetical protein
LFTPNSTEANFRQGKNASLPATLAKLQKNFRQGALFSAKYAERKFRQGNARRVPLISIKLGKRSFAKRKIQVSRCDAFHNICKDNDKHNQLHKSLPTIKSIYDSPFKQIFIQRF